jgi:hypothetical protein
MMPRSHYLIIYYILFSFFTPVASTAGVKRKAPEPPKGKDAKKGAKPGPKKK